MKKHFYKKAIYYAFLVCSLSNAFAMDNRNQFPDDLDSLEEKYGTLEIGNIDRSFTPQDAVDVLVNNLHAQIILQQDLYLHTNPINTRSIHDFPQIYIDTGYFPDCRWRFNVQPFFQFTWRGNFTKNSQFIRSYVALNNPNILEQLDDLVNDPMSGQKLFDIPTILALFEPLKIQERRAGFMFGGEKYWNGWNFWIKAPLIYLERNFFLTKAEKQAIEDAEIFDDKDPTTDLEEQQIKFARKHLISDKLGIGDTRFRFGYDVVNNPDLFVTLGGEITIPTAFAFAKGLYGEHFPKDMQTPSFNIFENLKLIFCPEPNLNKVKMNVEEFLLQVIDRLSAMLLEQKLGNGGHIGIAAYMRSDIQVTDCLRFSGYSALEYILPAAEQRFYIKKKNQSEFIDRDYTDPDLAEANLIFFNNQLINTLFPTMYETTIFPGFVFKFGTWLTSQLKCVDFTLGYDLWWQGQERLGHISAPQDVKNILRTDIAQKPGGMQHKVFGGVNYLHQHDDRDWCLGAFADITFFQFGVGKDFSISIKYEMNV